jgi:hypothetical protein
LIGLGSAGVELDRLDDYSDLDFFVVAKDRHKAEFIANLDWLSRARPISFAFKNTSDGYKVLFDDDIYAEFAVFELGELENAIYTPGRLVWKDDAFDEQWRIPKKQPVPWRPESREWLIGEMVTCLYVGLCRLRRGEQLSAWRFVQGHAFTLLLELVEYDRSDHTSMFKDALWATPSRVRAGSAVFGDTISGRVRAEILHYVINGMRCIRQSSV